MSSSTTLTPGHSCILCRATGQLVSLDCPRSEFYFISSSLISMSSSTALAPGRSSICCRFLPFPGFPYPSCTSKLPCIILSPISMSSSTALVPGHCRFLPFPGFPNPSCTSKLLCRINPNPEFSPSKRVILNGNCHSQKRRKHWRILPWH